jgi:hypothetical protein
MRIAFWARSSTCLIPGAAAYDAPGSDRGCDFHNQELKNISFYPDHLAATPVVMVSENDSARHARATGPSQVAF